MSYDAEKFLRSNPAFSGVMVGEGEETFQELAGHYIEGKPENLKEIRGVAFRNEDKVPDIRILKSSKTGSFIMKAAEAAPFPAVTVFRLLIRNFDSAILNL